MRYLPSKSPSERVLVSQDKILALGVKCLLNRKIGALRRIVAATMPLHGRNAPDARSHTRSRVRRSHSYAHDILVGTFMGDEVDGCKQRFTGKVRHWMGGRGEES